MTEDVSAAAPVLDQPTRLAFARTRVAYERTMMAWIRTATSLITFGFTIYKFFQLEVPRNEERAHLIGPRQFAIALVGIGLFSLVIATFEFRQNLRTLGAEYAQVQRSLSVVTAGLVSLLGIVALVLMIFRQ